jgi:hypothetical protein
MTYMADGLFDFERHKREIRKLAFQDPYPPWRAWWRTCQTTEGTVVQRNMYRDGQMAEWQISPAVNDAGERVLEVMKFVYLMQWEHDEAGRWHVPFPPDPGA